MNTVAITAPTKVEYRFREKDGYRRPTLELELPLPTRAGIVTLLQDETVDEKTKVALVEAVQALVINFVRGHVNSNEDFSQEDVSKLITEGKLDLQAIANLPRSERNTITNADLAAFAKVFVDTAKKVESTDKKIVSEAGAQVAAAAFTNRLRGTEGKNDVLDKLAAILERFTAAVDEEVLAEHASVVEWLMTKMEEAKKKDEIKLDDLE